jgi:hypothetical protein
MVEFQSNVTESFKNCMMQLFGETPLLDLRPKRPRPSSTMKDWAPGAQVVIMVLAEVTRPQEEALIRDKPVDDLTDREAIYEFCTLCLKIHAVPRKRGYPEDWERYLEVAEYIVPVTALYGYPVPRG